MQLQVYSVMTELCVCVCVRANVFRAVSFTQRMLVIQCMQCRQHSDEENLNVNGCSEGCVYVCVHVCEYV